MEKVVLQCGWTKREYLTTWFLFQIKCCFRSIGWTVMLTKVYPHGNAAPLMWQVLSVCPTWCLSHLFFSHLSHTVFVLVNFCTLWFLSHTVFVPVNFCTLWFLSHSMFVQLNVYPTQFLSNSMFVPINVCLSGCLFLLLFFPLNVCLTLFLSHWVFVLFVVCCT